MPKKTNDVVAVRIYQLRRGGLTEDSILTRLHLEFNQRLQPDRSTIARHVKRLESIPEDQAAEDLPFQWAALDESGWDQARLRPAFC